MSLLDINTGEVAEITKIRGRGAFRRRVMEMGLVVGEKITVIRKAPFNDPIEYEIKGYKIILRSVDAKLIDVGRTFSEKEKNANFETLLLDSDTRPPYNSGNSINIALIGNSTSGKTTIFNYFTGLNERIGNYAGVTVEIKKHQFDYKGYHITLFDMPGIYSLSGNQPQQTQIREFLYSTLPDVIINVVDASNLERNLYLTTDLIDSDLKVIMALNMFDDFQKNGNQLDTKSLGIITGVPIIPVTASRNKDLDEIMSCAIGVFEDKDRDQRHVHINYGEQIERSVKNIQQFLKTDENSMLINLVSSRFLAIKLLQNDKISEEQIKICPNYSDINQSVNKEKKHIENLYTSNSEQLITDFKFGFINGALRETLTSAKETNNSSEIIDSILTHKVFGLPIFFFFMWLMFTATFKIGSYPMHWIDRLVNLLSQFTAHNMPDGTLKDLLVDGVFSGVGGVLVFLPNILILYFFISLMEDTGYMSRAVFIMDKIMHRIGLHGKSFIPLVMGFGCNVPAILSSRMLENKKERLITILINPFISCNARLPIYILFITAFFAAYSGTVLFIIYFTGIAVAVATALILKRFIVSAHEQPFVMELPPYRPPSVKVIWHTMWDKSSQYLKKIGGVILISSIIFWALSYFPLKVSFSKNFDTEITATQKKYNGLVAALPPADTASIRQTAAAGQKEITALMLAKKSEKKELSYLGKFGHFIEPVISPLGFDWRIGIAILSGIPAKEIIVSSLAVLYQVDNETDPARHTLVNRIKAQTYTYGPHAGEKIFNPAVALAFMLFVLLYIPCIGTLQAIRKETGSWRWSLFSAVYSFALAWVLAFVVFRVGSLFL
jgi:ferrous iron transport protein B